MHFGKDFGINEYWLIEAKGQGDQFKAVEVPRGRQRYTELEMEGQKVNKFEGQ